MGPGHIANADGPSVPRHPPTLGEHTAEILGELGYDNTEIEAFARDQVI